MHAQQAGSWRATRTERLSCEECGERAAVSTKAVRLRAAHQHLRQLVALHWSPTVQCAAVGATADACCCEPRRRLPSHARRRKASLALGCPARHTRGLATQRQPCGLLRLAAAAVAHASCAAGCGCSGTGRASRRSCATVQLHYSAPGCWRARALHPRCMVAWPLHGWLTSAQRSSAASAGLRKPLPPGCSLPASCKQPSCDA
jgi:hypothetical protein